MNLPEAVNLFLTARQGVISPKTIMNYTQCLMPMAEYFGERPIDEITRNDLRAWRQYLLNRRELYPNGHSRRRRKAGSLSPWTVNSYVRVTRTFFQWLFDEGHLQGNPAHRFERVPIPQIESKGIGEDDLQKMLIAARRSKRDYALLLFMAESGARVAGVAGLMLEDLDLDHGSAIVREKHKGGNKSRPVFFSEPTQEALRDWLKERDEQLKRIRKPGEHNYRSVFVGHKGPITTNGISQALNRIAKQAGVENRHNAHSFRHGLARALLQRGADLARVSRILGHSDVRVTAAHYAIFSTAELKEAHKKYSWISGKRKRGNVLTGITPDDKRQWLTVAETAQLLGLTRATVYLLAAERKLAASHEAIGPAGEVLMCFRARDVAAVLKERHGRRNGHSQIKGGQGETNATSETSKAESDGLD